MSGTEIHGRADPAFASCLEAFRSNLAEGHELGAACAIYVDGRCVLDAWGGIADGGTTRPWNRETVVPVFSVTKGIAALCVLALVERGLLDLDLPVAQYWPEFGVHGKDRVTIREALAHRAGVPVVSGPVTIEDLRDVEGMSARLAREVPLFAPGTAHVYHALTIGWITSELVRRATGQSVGRWLEEYLARPRRLNLRIGGSSIEALDVARVDVPPAHDTPSLDPQLLWARPISLNGLITPSMSGLVAALNRPEMQQVELAGANALADARSLAKLYAEAIRGVDGEPLLSPGLVASARHVMSQGDQWGINLPGPTWGAGVMLPWSVQPMLGAGSFGHDGAGGSLAFAHPLSGITFAYVRNRAGPPNVVDPAVYRVVRALADAIGANIDTP